MTSPTAIPPHIAPDELQAYLQGWVDDPTSESIELHLADCPICEETLVALEGDGNTLIERIREVGVNDTPPSPRPMSPAPPAKFGAYEIIRPLARGGMGAVYLGKHTQLNKTVAIKLVSLPSQAGDPALNRFAKEIRAAGGLDHPAIVTATDAGQHDQFHYLVMEFIDGQDVSQIARAVGTLSVADSCEIIRVAAEALSHAHGEGIVHRDIKPSNLMIDRGGNVKLLDFGLAQVSTWDEATAELTTVGQLMGTLDYMAPEQAEHPETVDYRADLYSLGATLFRLLCGRAPLSPTPNLSPLAKLRLLANHHPPRADSLRDDLPKGLGDLIDEMLASDPKDRPASATHIAERLQSFCDGNALATLVTSSSKVALQSMNEPSRNRTFARANGHVGHGGNRRWWIATAAVPLFALAGILFTLETQKGSLVIDSEAEVTIKLTKDGQVHDEVKVQPGTTTTKLYAGKYEITLSGGSDSFVIDKDVIELTKGETSIARVRSIVGGDIVGWNKESQAQSRQTVQNAGTAPKRLVPAYDGKPLSHWTTILRTERSPEALQRAVDAIAALSDTTDAGELVKLLIDVGPKLSAVSGNVGGNLASLLRRLTSAEEYANLATAELQKDGNESWKRRLIQDIDDLVRQKATPTQLQPLLDWIDANVLAGDAHEMLQYETKRLYQRLARYGWDGQQRVIDAMIASPRLDDKFWLTFDSPDDVPAFVAHRWARMKAMMTDIQPEDELFTIWLKAINEDLRRRVSPTMAWLRDDPLIRAKIEKHLDSLNEQNVSQELIRQHSPHDLVTYRRILTGLLRYIDHPLAIDVDQKLFSYAERILERFDKNSDGLLTSDEMEKMLIKPMDADLNEDGMISVGEYAAYLAAKQKKK